MVRYECSVNEHDGGMVTTCQQPGASLVPKTGVHQLIIYAGARLPTNGGIKETCLSLPPLAPQLVDLYPY